MKVIEQYFNAMLFIIKYKSTKSPIRINILFSQRDFSFLAMMDHPPIPVSELAKHNNNLKADNNNKFSQEYKVGNQCIYW